MRVLGVEGTAWCASAAVFDAETDSVFIDSDPYEPDSGGIHPREAAEHMGEAIPRVIETALDHARTEYGDDDDSDSDGDGSGDSPTDSPVDAVAFSRGPGLGPCLRIVATAARALARTLDVPLVGVNHMVAHLEIGRHRAGFDSPVCLNASGANAHLLGYHDGRYRVLGETMDTGVGNALDKFTRHVGWSHPGGPKIEEHAKSGEFVELPYVVKGMDFSFSGIMSAAKAAYDDGVPVEDVCFSLQEHVFAMLTEVAERALSLTGTDELVLGGGVGQNARLREMLAEMCDERGADFHAPEPRFLRDNAGMIAVLGAKMAAAGDAVAVDESAIDPDFRPDQVPVTWRDGEESVARVPGDDDARDLRGAEAIVTVDADAATKRRLPKGYRHPELDATLRRERTVAEARLLAAARRAGVPTPLVHDVDVSEATLRLQRVGDRDLAAALGVERARTVGEHLARLHAAGIVHGDPTTRNVRVTGGVGDSDGHTDFDADRLFCIDFGLGFNSDHVEDYAMDLHVFEQSIEGTADEPDALVAAVEEGYRAVGDPAVLERLRGVEGRGRYQ
ncbi:bifunctional N(6)-L-threonylcarbamoyladenine synthase/serine/threonine protein kinase [Halobaculum sp. CBA1158]|uniref:bifunctional N(6)-L-threonylcarbamoyladenine synthase/serine/threonine protein kinase n=1 Tax=Halobaculum sp. CBA1158 TaxID=2904243 RepID=UPI001F2AF8BC|nr:bifunctional N(6)-L-threonylcarbamoyladenine synthase/serine/threonine protein kinase [Halobaculum sp. CBA1158]UIP00022.1 bifunctional N(6)-L-threonylcarbamoyladenine synthase/serine/threonine protein kinase [Halobaculum sp. CBA1158]